MHHFNRTLLSTDEKTASPSAFITTMFLLHTSQQEPSHIMTIPFEDKHKALGEKRRNLLQQRLSLPPPPSLSRTHTQPPSPTKTSLNNSQQSSQGTTYLPTYLPLSPPPSQPLNPSHPPPPGPPLIPLSPSLV